MSTKLTTRTVAVQSTKKKKPAGAAVKGKKGGGGGGDRKSEAKQDDPKLTEYLEILKKKSTLEEAEIRERYKQFSIDVPNGKLSKLRFIELSGEALGPDAENVADTIFKVSPPPASIYV